MASSHVVPAPNRPLTPRPAPRQRSNAPPGPTGIEARSLTKRYGGLTVVDDLSFTVQPGVVTGFLGPNGAGKSTTLRMLLGLAAPTSGTILIGGRRLAEYDKPARVVGALLDATALHPARSATDHLLAYAQAAGAPGTRVGELLDRVGLGAAGRQRAGDLSLGMKQRLGLATALLGDPRVLVLDEPLNGLDPEGIRWMRALMRSLAQEGRTVLFSSHLMAEMALTADQLIVIAKGRLVSQSSLAAFVDRHAEETVLVRAANRDAVARALGRAGARFEPDGESGLRVRCLGAAAVGQIAAAAGIALEELTPVRTSLEDIFLGLTREGPEAGGRP